MRRSFSSLCRLVACLLVVSMLASGFAMAAYVCPQLLPAPAMVMEDGSPCAEVDQQQPVHCAVFKSGADIAVEHVSAAPVLAPMAIAFIWPVACPGAEDVPPSLRDDATPAAGADPPYSRTQRLRI